MNLYDAFLLYIIKSAYEKYGYAVYIAVFNLSVQFFNRTVSVAHTGARNIRRAGRCCRGYDLLSAFYGFRLFAFRNGGHFQKQRRQAIHLPKNNLHSRY